MGYPADPYGPNLWSSGDDDLVQAKNTTITWKGKDTTVDFESGSTQGLRDQLKEFEWDSFDATMPWVPDFATTATLVNYEGPNAAPKKLMITFRTPSGKVIQTLRLTPVGSTWEWLADTITLTEMTGPFGPTSIKEQLHGLVWPKKVSVPDVPKGTTKALVLIGHGAEHDSSGTMSVQFLHGTKTLEVCWWKYGAWSYTVNPGPSDTYIPQSSDDDWIDTPEKLDAFFGGLAANPPDKDALWGYTPESDVAKAKGPYHVKYGPADKSTLISKLKGYPWPDGSYPPYVPNGMKVVKVHAGSPTGKYPLPTVEFYKVPGPGAMPPEQFQYAVQWDPAAGKHGMWLDEVKVNPAVATDAEQKFFSTPPEIKGVTVQKGSIPFDLFSGKNEITFEVKHAPGDIQKMMDILGMEKTTPATAVKASMSSIVAKLKVAQAHGEFVTPEPPAAGLTLVGSNHTESGQIFRTYQSKSGQKISAHQVAGVLKGLDAVTVPPPHESYADMIVVTTHKLRPASVRLMYVKTTELPVKTIADYVWVPHTKAWFSAGWWNSVYTRWVDAVAGVSIVNPAWDTKEQDLVRHGLKWLAGQGVDLDNPHPELDGVVHDSDVNLNVQIKGKVGFSTPKSGKLFEFEWVPGGGCWALASGFAVKWFVEGDPAKAGMWYDSKDAAIEYAQEFQLESTKHPPLAIEKLPSALGYWDAEDGPTLIRPEWDPATQEGVLATLHWVRGLTAKEMDPESCPDEAIGLMEYLTDEQDTIQLSVNDYDVAAFRWSPGAKIWYLWRGRFFHATGKQFERMRNWPDLESLHGEAVARTVFEEEAHRILTSALSPSGYQEMVFELLGKDTPDGYFVQSKGEIVSQAVEAVKLGKPIDISTVDTGRAAKDQVVPWKFETPGFAWTISTDKWSMPNYLQAKNFVEYMTDTQYYPQVLDQVTMLKAPHQVTVLNGFSENAIKYTVHGVLVAYLADNGAGWVPDFPDAIIGIGTHPIEVITKPVKPATPAKDIFGQPLSSVQSAWGEEQKFPHEWMFHFGGHFWTMKKTAHPDTFKYIQGALTKLGKEFHLHPNYDLGSLGQSFHGSPVPIHFQYDAAPDDDYLTMSASGMVVAVFRKDSVASAKWVFDPDATGVYDHLTISDSSYEQATSGFAASQTNVSAKVELWKVQSPWGQIAVIVPSGGWIPATVQTAQKVLLWLSTLIGPPPTDGMVPPAIGDGAIKYTSAGKQFEYWLFGAKVGTFAWCKHHGKVEPGPHQGLSAHAKLTCEACGKSTPGCGCLIDAKPAKKYTAQLSDLPKPQKWIAAVKKEFGQLADWEKQLLGLSGLSDVDAAVALLEHKKLLGHDDRIAKLKAAGLWDGD